MSHRANLTPAAYRRAVRHLHAAYGALAAAMAALNNGGAHADVIQIARTMDSMTVTAAHLRTHACKECDARGWHWHTDNDGYSHCEHPGVVRYDLATGEPIPTA